MYICIIARTFRVWHDSSYVSMCFTRIQAHTHILIHKTHKKKSHTQKNLRLPRRQGVRSAKNVSIIAYTHRHNQLQQTATDCNRLQQTATRRRGMLYAKNVSIIAYRNRRNQLQLTATDCNRLQQTATRRWGMLYAKNVSIIACTHIHSQLQHTAQHVRNLFLSKWKHT